MQVWVLLVCFYTVLHLYQIVHETHISLFVPVLWLNLLSVPFKSLNVITAIAKNCTKHRRLYFFRLCLGQWSDHGERTGGFYACNRYEAAKQEGVVCNTWIYVASIFFTWAFVMFFCIKSDCFLVIEMWIGSVWWIGKEEGDGQELLGKIHSLLWAMGIQPIGMLTRLLVISLRTFFYNVIVDI